MITQPLSRVLLAIPVYNEQRSLMTVLDAALRYIPHIVVIDDGSTDETPVLLARRQDVCMVRHGRNCGYGRSILHAFQMAVGCGFDWVITMDCDWQHEPGQIPVFLEAIARDEADILSGSRYLPESGTESTPPEDRRKINQEITRLINQTLWLKLTDAFCGFKACRVDAIQKLQLSEAGYAFPLEFWVEAARHNLRIQEIPIRLIYNDPNRSFGSRLDDPQTRLRHYQEVLHRTLKNAGLPRKESCRKP